MRRTFSTLLASLTILSFSACNIENSTSAQSMQISMHLYSAPNSTSVSSSYIYEHPEFDLHQEPPLAYEELAFYVNVAPDFLDDNLQYLYRRASAMISPFVLSTGNIDSLYPLLEGQPYLSGVHEKFQPDDPSLAPYYYYSWGRYQKWEHFKAVMYDIFTTECVEYLNNQQGHTLFIEADNGRLAFTDGDRGGNASRSGVPDSFVLISMTETEIVFEVVGHYMNIIEDESYADMRARAETSFDYTENYPIKFVLTDGGWRVAEFNVTY